MEKLVVLHYFVQKLHSFHTKRWLFLEKLSSFHKNWPYCRAFYLGFTHIMGGWPVIGPLFKGFVVDHTHFQLTRVN